MFRWITNYTRWLHTRWPAGTVENLPEVRDDHSTAIPGLYIVGDLTGIPLLKFSSDSGARVVRQILNDSGFRRDRGAADEETLDLVIVGAGVSGMAAAIEASKAGLRYEILEATEPFSTIVNFPKGKPIYTYPTDMTPEGDLQFGEGTEVKEGLVDELKRIQREYGIDPRQAGAEEVRRTGGGFEVQLRGGETLKARRVIVGIGRSGNFRKLNVPGEDRDKVFNRLHDPKEYCDKRVLVVGGGDSALETAIALTECGADVALSYRKPEFSRPKPENVEKIHSLAEDPRTPVGVEEPSSERETTSVGPYIEGGAPGRLTLLMETEVRDIRDHEVEIVDKHGEARTLENDVVFRMIGREPPLDFFRRSGVPIRGEWRARSYISLAAVLLFFLWMYHWKNYSWTADIIDPGNLMDWVTGLGATLQSWARAPGHLFYTLKTSMSGPSFYYTLAYSTAVVVFGVRRIQRRKTPYIKVQTLTLMAIQVIPLFILPEILLPWAGRNGLFETGTMGGRIADWFFESYDSAGHERAYWRAYGFVLAWPLFVYNWFTQSPLMGWLVVGVLQTFVIIPAIIYKWGKGAYCGWICSCGALAETLGDAHRHKMPHGPGWNRLNMLGQVILLVALVMLGVRIVGWVAPAGSGLDRTVENVFSHMLTGKSVTWNAEAGRYMEQSASGAFRAINYRWMVDLVLAGVLGIGLYFHFSGRMWCRFACPLAALMHIYARFSRFRILADKKKCISCNVCTSVCHQGIDIMNFANKGIPMSDPECVRCSACVHACPTGVLSFGEVDPKTGEVLREDKLSASPVRAAEKARPS